MALPIAATPELKGQVAERFLAKIEEDLKHPAGPVPTPGIDEAVRRLSDEKISILQFAEFHYNNRSRYKLRSDMEPE